MGPPRLHPPPRCDSRRLSLVHFASSSPVSGSSRSSSSSSLLVRLSLVRPRMAARGWRLACAGRTTTWPSDGHALSRWVSPPPVVAAAGLRRRMKFQKERRKGHHRAAALASRRRQEHETHSHNSLVAPLGRVTESRGRIWRVPARSRARCEFARRRAVSELRRGALPCANAPEEGGRRGRESARGESEYTSHATSVAAGKASIDRQQHRLKAVTVASKSPAAAASGERKGGGR